MKRSKTNTGFLYFLEKILRSHPLLYFIVRQFIIYTNIFEEDANGVVFLNLGKSELAMVLPLNFLIGS